MKTTNFLLLLGLLWLTGAPSAAAQSNSTPDGVLQLMTRVADWQIDSYDRKHSPDTNWENGALFVGMNHWAALARQVTGSARYADWLGKVGRRTGWQPGPRMYHADDLTVVQTWLRLAEENHQEAWTYPAVARLDFVVSHPSDAPLDLRLRRGGLFDRWSWCDALFMAPPVYLKLYLMTGQKKYLKFMHREYQATTNYLYDRDEQLFYRDSRYFDKRENNGQKVFWGRGNGWVIAGLAEMLQLLPAKCRIRNYYLNLYRAMCHRLKNLQQPDGYWHASLLDPASYPSPETSATGFITYALAYGVRSGLLPEAEYRPTVERGWQAMCQAVDETGKLGFVQPIGADPQKVTRDMTEVYGPGAFLALGCEMYRLYSAQ